MLLSSLSPYLTSTFSVFPVRALRQLSLINLRSCCDELRSLLFHTLLQSRLLVQFFLRGVLAHVLRDLHGAEVRAAHRAEVRELCALLRQGFVVIFTRDFRVEREVELVFPAKLEARFRESVVPELRTQMSL